MQVRCITARQGVAVGDLVEVPDDASVSPLYFEVVDENPPPGRGTTRAADSTQPESSPASSAPADKDGV